MNIVLDAGGDDLNDEGENWEILTDPAAYETVANAVKAAKVETTLSRSRWLRLPTPSWRARQPDR